MCKLCVFAGTTEGRKLVELLADQPAEVTACVATEYGEALLEAREGLTVSAGRLTEAEMEALLRREGFDLVIDATHPYAAEVTENIVRACEAVGTEYLRLLRGSGDAPQGAVCVPDIGAAVTYLAGTEGNILLTTGSKELSKYASLPGFGERVYARVLPMEASLAACREAGLGPEHILAMQGPFSKEMNTAMLRAVSGRYMVTKETGSTGGFSKKAAAAAEAGAVLLVVGRPPQRAGVDFAGAAEMLSRRFGLRLRPRVTLVGIGPGSEAAMTNEVRRVLREADCLIGARRMLEAAGAGAKRQHEAVAPEEIAAHIRESRDCCRFAVLLSGDTGFFSGAKRLLPLLEDCEVEILPGLSSLQVLCARLRVSYEDVVCRSLHGRDGDVIPDVRQNRRVFVLVGGAEGVSGLCHTLTEAGLAEVQVSVGERLGYPEEQVTSGRPPELMGRSFAPLSAVLIENNRARPFIPGLSDEAFQRGRGQGGVVPMTKREVRACVLSQLELTREAVCWDIGAGTGSVSIEMALLAREGRVYAVEKKPEALALLEENRRRFHTANVEIVAGAAPEACRSLPAPTHAFIGGSAGNLREIVELLLEKSPKVRITAAAVSLETAAELTAIGNGIFAGDYAASCITVARDRRAGRYHLMAGQNPVYLFTFQR